LFAPRVDLQAAAQKLGKEIRILNASTEQDVDRAFTGIAQIGAGALLIGTDPFLATCVEQMVGLAARYSIPTIYARHECVRAGGLMSCESTFLVPIVNLVSTLGADMVETAMMDRRIESIYGWPLRISNSPNKRTLFNFPMQYAA
jgi:hypothetical protein